MKLRIFRGNNKQIKKERKKKLKKKTTVPSIKNLRVALKPQSCQSVPARHFTVNLD